MGEVVITLHASFRDFIRKTTLGNEIDIPVEVTKDKILVRRKDLAMKIYGEFKSFEIVNGNEFIEDTLLLGIPNAKRLSKYLTVIGDTPTLIKPIDKNTDIDKIYLTNIDDTDVTFEVVLSVLSQPDVTPLKLSDFFVDTVLPGDKIKKMFEILKLINSDECGVLVRESSENNDNWEVVFKVGSKYEDKGEVVLTTINTLPEFNSKFVTQIGDEYFIKFHQQDVNSTLSVMDKGTGDITAYFRLKSNGAMVISEESDNFVVHYGFVPYV